MLYFVWDFVLVEVSVWFIFENIFERRIILLVKFCGRIMAEFFCLKKLTAK